MRGKSVIGTLISVALAGPVVAFDPPGPSAIVPAPNIKILVEHVGTMPSSIGPGLVLGTTGGNLQSPVAGDNVMYFIDQFDAIYSANGNGKNLKKIFSISDGDAPEGLVFQMNISDGVGGTIAYQQRQAVFNVAPGKDDKSLYVVLTANVGSTLPDVPRYELPSPISGDCCFLAGPPSEIANLYDITPEEVAPIFFIPFTYPGIEHQILYEFEIKGKRLKNPRAIAIFDSQGGPLHHGAALLRLRDGRLLFWTGDAVPFGLSGLEAPQDLSSHLSKILIVDPADGSVEVAASGVRNVQHAEIARVRGLHEDWITFADIGGWTAEEVNAVPLADLLDTSDVENFGWGINPDGMAREGTFYVATGGFGSMAFTVGSPAVIANAPVPEPGYIQPHAQYERPNPAPAPGTGDPNGGVASTGPVTSKEFKDLTMVFSDLSSGALYGTMEPLSTVDATVFKLKIVDDNGVEHDSLLEMTGLPRVDPRLFRFADGSAGVLLEATGGYYRLTEMQ